MDGFNVLVTVGPLTITGEYETFVCDGPTIKCRIHILRSEGIWESKTGSGYLMVDEAELVQKRGTK